jgi:multidrug efflux pump subunit AcrA (membrane-fusion protein)
MKWNWKTVAAAAGVAGLLVFNLYTYVTVAQKPDPAEPPDLDEAPVRLYGRIEPEGGEVFVSASVSRSVIEIHAREGDLVEKGDPIVTLENDVERTQLQVAEARLQASRTAAELSRDEYQRKRELAGTGGITDFEILQARLRWQRDREQITVAEREAEAAAEALDRLTLQAPVSGMIHRFDLNLGETMMAGDDSLIMMGDPAFQARLYLETYWIGYLESGETFTVYSAETGEPLGRGSVRSLATSLSAKKIRTEDPAERFDTLYREVVLSLEPGSGELLSGLSVYAEKD